MKLKQALFCDFAQGAPNGKLNLFGVFDVLIPQALPTDTAPFFLYALFELSGEDVFQDDSMFQMDIKSPTGRTIWSQRGELATLQPSPYPEFPVTFTAVVYMANVRLLSPGPHKTTLTVNGVKLKGPTLNVPAPQGLQDNG